MKNVQQREPIHLNLNQSELCIRNSRYSPSRTNWWNMHMLLPAAVGLKFKIKTPVNRLACSYGNAHLHKYSIRTATKCRKWVGKIFQTQKLIATAIAIHGYWSVCHGRCSNSLWLNRENRAAKEFHRQSYCFVDRSRIAVCTIVMIHRRITCK